MERCQHFLVTPTITVVQIEIESNFSKHDTKTKHSSLMESLMQHEIW